MHIALRFKGSRNKPLSVVNTPLTAAKVAIGVIKKEVMDWREEAFILFLTSTNLVIGHLPVGIGGTQSVAIDHKCVAAIAYMASTPNIILVHNHPSGDITPSKADITTTRRLQKVLKRFDLTLVDHLIIANQQHYSLKEHAHF